MGIFRMSTTYGILSLGRRGFALKTPALRPRKRRPKQVAMVKRAIYERPTMVTAMNLEDLRCAFQYHRREPSDRDGDLHLRRLETFDLDCLQWVELTDFEQLKRFPSVPYVRLGRTISFCLEDDAGDDDEPGVDEQDSFIPVIRDDLGNNRPASMRQTLRLLDQYLMYRGIHRLPNGTTYFTPITLELLLSGEEAPAGKPQSIQDFLLEESKDSRKLQDFLLSRPGALEHIENVFRTMPFLLQPWLPRPPPDFDEI
mmetsp:Transcript_9429/g.19304  ORF Transcript_9429/g.19304 Transcript_9429/m.19304 type:complete len:256 (-) Transcript_9429:1103-1870(-)